MGASPASHKNTIHATTHNTATSKLLYIKLPMPLFFYMDLILNGFQAGKSNTRGIGRGGTLKSRLYWPKWHSLHLSRFPGPTPFNAPRNGSCPPQNRYRAIQTSGTIIVIKDDVAVILVLRVSIMVIHSLGPRPKEKYKSPFSSA